MMDISPQFAALLPADALAKIKEVQADDNMDALVRHDKVTEILLTLGPDLHAKIEALPPPPFADKMPEELRNKFKAVREDKSLSFADKCGKIREIIASIPEEQRQKMRAAFKQAQ